VRIALATCAALPPEFDDDERLLAALARRGADAVHAVWDGPSVRWDDFDLVVIRTTWDYPRKHAAFLEWADGLDGKLENPARIVHWNSDKHHVADLIAAGIPTVPTSFVEPGDSLPPLEGEVVVKPAISVGGRDTGRFGPATHEDARALLVRLQAEGRAAMVQPYLSSVDTAGETALVFMAGSFHHAARKRAVLRPDEVAPMREDEIGGAEVMYGLDIVGPGTASRREIDVGEQALAYARVRFGVDLLYARVDVVADANGDPVILEFEAVEPNLFLRFADGAADWLAEAILARTRST
jgi:glutathione synthase/RimK-type ligase-like ATP-grasp enzyme